MKKQPKLGLVLAAAALISVAVASLVSARGWVQEGAEWRYVDNDGEYVSGTLQSSGTSKFYLNDEGYMVKDYFLEDYNSNNYYFGSNGAMVTNTWVAIESGMTDNQGDYVPDNYWYYFQASGKAVKAPSSDKPKKMVIDGKKYMFNEYGQMCTGWIDADGKVIDPDTDEEGGPFASALYYAGGDNDGVLRTGWVTYYDGWNGEGSGDYQSEKNTIYFYFNTSTNKKIGYSDGSNNNGVTKKINGKTYAFDSTGIMLSGWDVAENDDLTSLGGKKVYFSGEDDGHQVKKGWVYAVPAQAIDSKAYDDGEEKYFYFGSNGEATVDTFKKVNSKYYVFNPNGIMKTGLILWCPSLSTNTVNGVVTCTVKYHFVKAVDLDWADGSDIAKKGKVRYDSDEDADVLYLHYDGQLYDNGSTTTFNDEDYTGKMLKFHFFGDDGARKTGTNTVSFSNDDYTFNSNTSGHRSSGKYSKKYYSLGIQLKASQDIKYGILVSTSNWFAAQQENYANNLGTTAYQVLNTAGSLQNKRTSKKDADGNWWLMGQSGYLYGIFNVEVKNVTKATTIEKYFDKYYWAALKATSVATWGTIQPNEKWSMHITASYSETGAYYTSMADIYSKIKTYLTRNDICIVADGDNFIKDNYVVVSLVGNKIKDVTYYGYSFKSEYDSSSKAIPFGLTDDTYKTARLEYVEADADTWYQVVPNNDYFLNAYWAD